MDRQPDTTLALHPIGRFHARELHPYDAARQGALADNTGTVCLFEGHGYEQALRDLAGFSHVWLLFWFDRNRDWKPVVTPPRGTRRVGVFASRSPYRPNPIGMSLVRLERTEGLTLHVRGHDLLDGTPVLDIKPYIAYADSAADATRGWLDEVAQEPVWTVDMSPQAEVALAWLAERGMGSLAGFLQRELSHRPTDPARKRVRPTDDAGTWEIAYRTWRADYRVDAIAYSVHVLRIRSGYAEQALAPGAPDRYADLDLHRAFRDVTSADGAARSCEATS